MTVYPDDVDMGGRIAKEVSSGRLRYQARSQFYQIIEVVFTLLFAFEESASQSLVQQRSKAAPSRIAGKELVSLEFGHVDLVDRDRVINDGAINLQGRCMLLALIDILGKMVEGRTLLVS